MACQSLRSMKFGVGIKSHLLHRWFPRCVTDASSVTPLPIGAGLAPLDTSLSDRHEEESEDESGLHGVQVNDDFGDVAKCSELIMRRAERLQTLL